MSKPSLIKKIDEKVQRYFDQIFPQNLKIRYILGLTIIGILTLAGHMLIQISLIKLSADERTIRVLENQIDASETFYREIIRLQTTSYEPEFKRQLETVDKDIIQLIEGHKTVMARVNRKGAFGIGFPSTLAPFKRKLTEAFDQLSNVFSRLGNIKYLEDPTLRLNDPIVVNFIKSENYYRDVLSELVKNYEAESREALSRFQRIELLFLILTILILFAEGLYVFRPAVRRVYSAIQSRSDFLSRLSHEIRNPMNSILGMTQLLSKTRPTPQQKNYIKILENSSLGLLEMLNNLLDYSALESTKLKLEEIKTDLYSVIEKALDLVTTKIQEKNLELVLDIDPDVPLKVISDPTRLQQVLVNLLSNAAKFTEMGHIILKVQLDKHSHTPCLKFSVIDSGVGIDQDKVDSIFESFVQENSSVRRKYGGTGLGLSIAKEIVTMMGGAFTVKTKKGQGSTFCFIVPLKVQEESKKLQDYIVKRLDGYRYFLIDKHEKVSESICKIIERQGGAVKRVGYLSSFDDLYIQITSTHYDKIFIDASTFAANLEDFLEYLNRKNYNMSNLCVLFNYIQSNYLFDLLNRYQVDNSFPKPIKPIEFINFLSGSVQEVQAMRSDEGGLFSEKRYKLLIAEDSADNRTLLEIYLEKHSVDIYFAENGKKAYELFQQQKFDAVFMDIQMPEMDGITATRLIRNYEKKKGLKHIPILAFSAHKPSEVFGDEDHKIFTDFVLKPINSAIVRTKLKQYLRFTENKSEPMENKKNESTSEFDVSDLIPSYLERRSKEIEQMKEYISNNDLNGLVRIGHQLKGSAKSYGFEELGELGNQLEQVAQFEDMNKIEEVVSQITQKISDYKKSYMN